MLLVISVGRISAYTELLQRVVLGVSDSEYHQLQRVVVLFVVCPDFLFTVSCMDILTGIYCDWLKCSEVWWSQQLEVLVVLVVLVILLRLGHTSIQYS